MRSPIKNAKTGFVQDVLTLSRGIFAAQVIAAGMSFVLTRLYTAEDFGEFALFAAALGMIGDLMPEVRHGNRHRAQPGRRSSCSAVPSAACSSSVL
jgi:hypothetical protein